MSRYVAAYDISRDSSRRAVARILLGYGARVQWSVFEVDLEPIDRRNPQRRVRWQREPYHDPVQLL